MFDIGVNLMNAQFDSDRDRVVAAAVETGVTTLLLTGTDIATSKRCLDYCRTALGSKHCFATAGVHPHDAEQVSADWLESLRELASANEVRAIGETGLDYNRNYSPKARQLEVFTAQLALAGELSMPLFVHDREASDDVFAGLARYRDQVPGIVVHCFTGDGTAMRRYLDIDCHIGITGWVCDKRRGEGLRALVPDIPIDRLLVETDAPFLLPHNAPKQAKDTPGRGRRNTPAHLVYVIERLAQLRGTEAATLASRTAANAQALFGIPAV